MDIYVCKNNTDLCYVSPEISFSWEDKYVGRRINESTFSDYIGSSNQYHIVYPENNYSYNLPPDTFMNVIHKDGIITGINTFKYRQSGSFSPKSKEVNISASDRTEFERVLNEVTFDIDEEIYQEVFSKLKIGDVLPGGLTVTALKK